jgi:flagellar protein FlaG
MDSNVAAVAATADMIGGGQNRPLPARSAKASRPVIDEVADLRLVIEVDEGSGSYVYKTINRATGEVVLQFPRDELLRLQASADYEAGALIKARA